MIIFVDTSAFFALLDGDDAHHHKARKAWNEILGGDNTFVTSNYVVVECFALFQHRIGMDAVRGFQDDLLSIINIEYVTASSHKAGVSAFLSAARRKLSLVDCTSFEIMRSLGIREVFAFDPHFKEQGFTTIP